MQSRGVIGSTASFGVASLGSNPDGTASSRYKMNNLAIILEQVLEARKLSSEQSVTEQLDRVIQTIIDVMKSEPNHDLPPINYPPAAPQPIPVSPFGGLDAWCIDLPDNSVIVGEAAESVNTRAKALAEKILGGR